MHPGTISYTASGCKSWRREWRSGYVVSLMSNDCIDSTFTPSRVVDCVVAQFLCAKSKKSQVNLNSISIHPERSKTQEQMQQQLDESGRVYQLQLKSPVHCANCLTDIFLNRTVYKLLQLVDLVRSTNLILFNESVKSARNCKSVE